MTKTMTRLMNALALVTVALIVTGCGGVTSQALDRNEIMISESSRMTARNMVPFTSKHPSLIEQLSQAQEVYQLQLVRLQSRRDDLRGRKRTLNFLSYGSLTATALSVGGVAIATGDGSDSDENLKTAGFAALGGAALGTLFQVAGGMQEDSSSLDAKIKQLDRLYDTMIERLRQLSLQAELAQTTASQTTLVAEMGSAIESFVSAAVAINVRG